MRTVIRPLDGIFATGRLCATRGLIAAVPVTEQLAALRRHLQGDWGEVSPDDWQANEESLVNGARLLSVYFASNGEKFWIITEADRSSTTMLLPSEY